MTADYDEALQQKIDEVLQRQPFLVDWRKSYPWLTSSLGDPYAGVWFVAENPSLSKVERAQDPGGGPPTGEAQWYAGPGDKLFRRSLVEAGFKDGTSESPGGWRCYVTNLVKAPDYVGVRNSTPGLAEETVRQWALVLRWQLEEARPKLVVLMGTQVRRLADLMSREHGIRWPSVATVEHYSYIAQRPRGRLRPMHPDRVKAYLDSFKDVKAQATARGCGGS